MNQKIILTADRPMTISGRIAGYYRADLVQLLRRSRMAGVRPLICRVRLEMKQMIGAKEMVTSAYITT
ncbi:hypothetical protein Y032_0054g2447 [Ancylostoma ceylanicum]|uniref:Uncharacterized protein n=1 Tax=Ancylostoma ceylanicum TaxID=53326 RepID=A0A016U6Q7_9BILA|nr:hypothetical protein Y032_0054g2447 [Ancylostoma ceylanicum]